MNELDSLKSENESLRRQVIDLFATVNRLKETSDMYRIVADTASDTILCTNEQSEIIYANPSSHNLLGYQPASLIGKKLTTLIPTQLQSKHTAGFEQFLQTGQKTIPWSGIELNILHADGTEIPVEVSFGVRINEQGEHRFTGFIRDSRPRKLLEQESRERLAALTHADRLKSAGELAAGLAHELNQPLLAVLLHADLANRFYHEPSESGSVSESLDIIIQQAQRASQILNVLRELIRKNEPSRIEFSVHDAVQSVVQLMQAELSSRSISLDLNLCNTDPKILGDRIQVEQVVLNLLKNSIDAIESSTTNIRSISILSQLSQDYVTIEVIDSGGGLPEEKASIFDNFFSTKENGLGIGLGICQSIMQRHHGQLTANNNDQGGATLRIQFPRLNNQEETT